LTGFALAGLLGRDGRLGDRVNRLLGLDIQAQIGWQVARGAILAHDPALSLAESLYRLAMDTIIRRDRGLRLVCVLEAVTDVRDGCGCEAAMWTAEFHSAALDLH
jgi:hypothetical protein